MGRFMPNFEDVLVRIPLPSLAALSPSQDTSPDQIAAFYRPNPIPFIRHSPLPVVAQSASGAVAKSVSQTQSQRTVLGSTLNINQIAKSAVGLGTQNNVNLSSASLSGSLTSLKVNTNVTSNFTNNATVDSIDNGTNATIRIYGPGGVGTTWNQFLSTQMSQNYPAGTLTGAYSTSYAIMFNPLTGIFTANTTGFGTLPDGLIFAGTLMTVAHGGGGGTGGGGGSGGGSGGGGGHKFF